MSEPKKYSTPSNRPAPFPNMTDEDLDDFEKWAKDKESDGFGPMILMCVCMAVIMLIVLKNKHDRRNDKPIPHQTTQTPSDQ